MPRLSTSSSSKKPVRMASVVFILGLLASFGPFSTDMYLAGLPAIAESFRTDVKTAQLTLSTFFFGLAIGQFFYGPISDHYGRRRPLLVGIVLFTAASFLEILTQDISTFLVLRFFQAIGGCAGMVIGRAIVSDLFRGKDAARVFSLLMLVHGIGPIAAPVLGSSIVAVASWRWILVFLTVLGAVCFSASFWGMPETLPPVRHQKLRLKRIWQIMLALCVRRAFIVPTLAGALAISAIFVYISGSPFVYMNLYGVSASSFGLLFALNALIMTAFSQVNTVALKYFSVAALFKAGLLLCSVLALGLVLVSATPSLPLFLTFLFAVLATLPVIAANSTALSMEASGKYAGNASTVMGVIQFCLAGLVSALVSVFHNETAYPMTGLIFGCIVAAGAVLVLGGKRALKTAERG